MELTMAVIISGTVLVIALVVFLIYRNLKDEKKFEKEVNEEDDHPLPSKKDDEKRI